MSSIFGHNLSATFRDRAYETIRRGGSLKVAAAFVVGVSLTALILKPIPDEARAAWAGGSAGIDVKAVQKDVSTRVAAHKQRKAAEVAALAKAPVATEADMKADSNSGLASLKPAQASAPAQSAQADAPAPNLQIAAAEPVPMPAPRPSAQEVERAQAAAAHRAAAAARKRIARAREQRRLEAEDYPAPQAYRASDGRVVTAYRRDPRFPPPNRYASRNTGPLGGLLGLFGVAD